MSELVFTPAHPKFVGKFPVYKTNNMKDIKSTDDYKNPKNFFIVDLARGLCTCPHGAPFVESSDGSPIAQSYCKHKLVVISQIVKKDPELMWPYIKILAGRYNKYEVVSAFHKELRRGDYDRAIYWGSILSTSRGVKGVIKYLLNILYEETRAHHMGDYLLTAYQHSVNKPDFESMKQCIKAFCIAPKKWELEGRLDIFRAEMQGYEALAKSFGYDVAKSKEIIDATHIPELTQTMLMGFKTGNRVDVQIGLKGLFKSKSVCKHEDHKDYIFGLLNKLSLGRYPNAFKPKSPTFLNAWLSRRRTVMGEHGYHELNALADLLCGEPVEYGELAGDIWADIRKSKPDNLKLGKLYQIPVYAQDNHTWVGKSWLRRYSWQLEKGVDQTDIDFRWCGAYLGVAWRYLAYNQFGTLDGVAWKDVKWPMNGPVDKLHKHVMRLFY